MRRILIIDPIDISGFLQDRSPSLNYPKRPTIKPVNGNDRPTCSENSPVAGRRLGALDWQNWSWHPLAAARNAYTYVMNQPIPNYRSQLPTSSSLDVFLLGAMELGDTLELLEQLRREVASRTDNHGTMLICEHPPSISIGREGSFADVLVDREELIARKMEVRWTNRGGATFVHLPGQISAYVVVPLERQNFGIVDFRSRLEQGLISTAADFKIAAERSASAPGAQGRLGQFAFIGVTIRDWISNGGVHLNVSLPQESLDLVRWNHSETRVTTLSTMRTRPIAISTARESFVRNLAIALGYESFHLYTGHPQLRRRTRKVYVYS